MKTLDEMDIVEAGRYFGYPDCCILHFLGRSVAMHAGYMKLAALPPKFPHNGTGYVPCPLCRATKNEIQMLEEITARRQAPTPFPEDGLSGEWEVVEIAEVRD